MDNSTSDKEIRDFDTIVVPAKKDTFEEIFLRQNQWYAIRILDSKINRIKHIACYETAPISAITHLAEVERIVRYRDSGKYIVYFKGKAEKIDPIKLVVRKRGAVPQAPRYALIKTLRKAKTMSEVF